MLYNFFFFIILIRYDDCLPDNVYEDLRQIFFFFLNFDLLIISIVCFLFLCLFAGYLTIKLLTSVKSRLLEDGESTF